MHYNGDECTTYKLGWNRGISGLKSRVIVERESNSALSQYAQGYYAGRKQYKRNQLEQLVLEEPK